MTKEFLILVSSSRTQCFRIQPRLQQSFPCSRQNINWYLDSIFYVSIFLVSGKSEGEEKHRETPPSLHYYFLFFQVGCTTMLFHTGFCSATRNWRKLCIRTVFSHHLTISEKKRLTYINLHR